MKGEGCMNITDVRVRCVAKEGKMKAVVSITIDEEFVVHVSKRLHRGKKKGLFIAMPSRKATDGEYRDIAHPINSATRERIQNIILEKYEQVLAEEPLEERNPKLKREKRLLLYRTVSFLSDKIALLYLVALTPAGGVFVFYSVSYYFSPTKRETFGADEFPALLRSAFAFFQGESFAP